MQICLRVSAGHFEDLKRELSSDNVFGWNANIARVGRTHTTKRSQAISSAVWKNLDLSLDRTIFEFLVKFACHFHPDVITSRSFKLFNGRLPNRTILQFCSGS